MALTRIAKCPTDGVRRYMHLDITYLKGKLANFTQNYRCRETAAQKRADATAELIAELAIKAKGAAVDSQQIYLTRSARDPQWVRVTGTTKFEPILGWIVDLKSDGGEWVVRYAGFEEEGANGEVEQHFVAGLPCDLNFSEGLPAC